MLDFGEHATQLLLSPQTLFCTILVIVQPVQSANQCCQFWHGHMQGHCLSLYSKKAYSERLRRGACVMALGYQTAQSEHVISQGSSGKMLLCGQGKLIMQTISAA